MAAASFRPVAAAVLAAWTCAGAAPLPGPETAAAAPEGHDIAWRACGPSGGGWIESLAFDPREKDVLLAGGDVGGFFFSADAGRTFEIRNRGLHDYFIESIADHPYHDDPTTAGLLKSRDGGRTWRRENTGLTLLNTRGVCISPHDPATLFLGTLGNGVFAGRDAAPRGR